MSPLQLISLSTLALTLVAIAIPWSRWRRELRFVRAIPAIVMLLQVAIEGYRWQMVPAYALGAIVLLAGLPKMIRRKQPTGETRRVSKALTIIGVFFGLIIVWISAELCAQIPSFVLPRPSGPYNVGTRTFLLVDESRIDDESPIGNGYRTMSIQVWYPATLTGDEERTTYLRSDIRQEMEALDGPPAWFYGYLDSIQTNTYWGATIARAEEPFPVVLYSPSGNASLHKILFEELTSQGYVVVSISHPHWSNVIFDDQGDVIAQGGVGPRFLAWFEEADTQAVRTAQGTINSQKNIVLVERAQRQLNAARPIAIAELREWAADDGFVLEQLAEMDLPGGFFAGRIDLERVGVMGFSLGGATAGQFCVTDARCQAGINVDGFMFGDILDNNLTVPFLFFHSSYPGARPVGALFYEWAEASAYMLQIAGANHHDLGAPSASGQPILLELGVNPGEFPDGAYLAQIMNDYIVAFFDKHLKQQPAPLLDGPSPYPEVHFVSKDGQ